MGVTAGLTGDEVVRFNEEGGMGAERTTIGADGGAEGRDSSATTGTNALADGGAAATDEDCADEGSDAATTAGRS